MKKVAILATGGTISSAADSRTELINYKSGTFTGDEIINQIPELREIADVHIEQTTNFSSMEMTAKEWTILREKALHYLNELDFDGVVITHGTNTIEETAYFLHLTCNVSKPIVIVGSQRPLTGLSSDAHLNVYNAVKLAASEDAVGKGVLVMMNDEINSAREVTKTNTVRLETFQSGQLGFLGYVDNDGVFFYRQPTRIHTAQSQFNELDTQELDPVEIVYSYAGADGNLIRCLIPTGVKGIVIAGTGTGRFSSKELEALVEAKKQGIAVVRSSRVGNGRVIPEEQYEPYGFVSGDNLLPQKARILLMLALKVTKDPVEIQRIFDTY
ncbi:asparaginase [Ammoniphilus resinae]|uniref:asparaginase n=1 Tax=Ammoniphilus resinae TaxID=861532 RepID=A0ABS4GLD3_9BACL|nr:L-asparaginase [Ammoniphilus resinae]